MKKFFMTLTSIFFLFAAFAQNEDSTFIRRIADEILLHGKAYDDLRVLTKQIGGRLTGSPQMVKAEQWGLQTIKALNPDKAWLQQCTVPHWIRGGKDEATAMYSKNKTKKLDVLALGNSIGSGRMIKADVIEVKNFDDLESKKDGLKGKIVFYNYKFNPAFITTFQSYGDAVQYRGGGA